jgi:parallel beta-helix repeat protein
MKKLFLSILISLAVIFTPLAQAEYIGDLIAVTSPWTDSRNYNSLSDAITDIGTSKRTLFIDRDESVTSLAIPSNIQLKFSPRGSITNTGLLKIYNKNIESDDHPIFTGTGQVDFAYGAVLRSAWFNGLYAAFTNTINDYVTLTICGGWSASLGTSVAVGNNVVLKWESPDNRIVVNAGVVLSNVRKIEAGDYQIFGGSGDIDFLDGSILNLEWFGSLHNAVNWIESEKVKLFLNTSLTVPTTDSIQSNIDFEISKGGNLSINNGITVTLQGLLNLFGTVSGAGNLTTSSDSILVCKGGVLSLTGALSIGGSFDSSFNYVFTGTSPTFLSSSTIKEVYPQWWGGLGNGIANDTTPIQSAIYSLTNGGVVFFTEGTYLITSSLIIPSNITLGGVGATSIITTVTPATTLIQVFGVKTAITSNLTVDAALHQTTVAVADGSIFTAGDYVLIESSGTPATDAYEINVISIVAGNNLTMEAPLYDTYLIADGAKVTLLNIKENVHIKNLKFINVSGGTGEGFKFQYAINSSVENCIIESGDRNEIYYSNYISILNNKITDFGLGVDVRYSKYNVIDKNSIYNGNSGIAFQYYSDACKITNNTIVKMLTYGIFYEHYSNDGLIEGNIVFNSGSYGLVMDYGCDHTRILGNYISNTGNTAIILVESDYLIVQGNDISCSAAVGLTLEASSYSTVSGNVISNIGTTTSHHGISVYSTVAQGPSQYNVISKNILSTIAGTGIYMVADGASILSDSLIEGNIIASSVGLGIRVGLTTVPTSISIRNNIIGTVSTIGTTVTTSVSGDYSSSSTVIDLSGAAVLIPIYHSVQRTAILSIQIVYTEASSADAGIKLEFGIPSDTNRTAEYTTEINKALWYTKTLSGSDFLPSYGAMVLADSTYTVYSPGGKTGAGEVKIIVNWCTVGG